MPLVSSSFQPPSWLTNAHLQTVLPVLLRPGPQLKWERECLELEDSDFLHLDWLRQPQPAPLAILSHGLEGSSKANYIRRLADVLHRAGWSVLAWNFRGCSGEPNRLLRSYHSGESADLRQVIEHAASSSPAEKISLFGFSLGGNITLKYLGEAPPHPCISSAVCLSVPVDLASSAQTLDEHPGNAFYLQRFLRTMRPKIIAKAQRFPGQVDLKGIENIRTFREFDDRYTAPMHGFVDADDYWARASSKPWLEKISVPTLLLSALDDPFLAPPCFPTTEAMKNAQLHLETPAHGGHVGFIGRQRGWWVQRALTFSVANPE